MKETKKKYNVVTLCGSTRFKKEFYEVWERLTLEGNIVIMISPFWRGESREFAEDVTDMFLRMHFQRIEMADELFVVNPGGYIGDRTKLEISHAMKLGKKISYLVNHSEFIGAEDDTPEADTTDNASIDDLPEEDLKKLSEKMSWNEDEKDKKLK